MSGYSTEQLIVVMRMLNASEKVLLSWYRLGVDGRRFATMSDTELRLYELDLPLVRQLRDASCSSLQRSVPDEAKSPYVVLTPKKDS